MSRPELGQVLHCGTVEQEDVFAPMCPHLPLMGWREHGGRSPQHPWPCAEQPEYGSVSVIPSSSFCNFV